MRVNQKKAKMLAVVFGVFAAIGFLGKIFELLPAPFANSFSLGCLILCVLILLGSWILLKDKKSKFSK